ncbi:TPA: GNAT family N-acetyltransferase [Legionella pneumophila]
MITFYQDRGRTSTLTDHVRSRCGEVRTLGVSPHYRGQGIGKMLLLYGLNYFSDKNYQNCYLTVATQNNSALRIYQNLGFSIAKHFQVYCCKFLNNS